MKDSELKACIDGLGLLSGEEKKFQYVCHRIIAPFFWNGKPPVKMKKGLLVFTNDNMIFMEQEGEGSSRYTQALRFPLEEITGTATGEKFIKYIDVLTKTFGDFGRFNFLEGCEENSDNIDDMSLLAERILLHIVELREEKRLLAQEARKERRP